MQDAYTLFQRDFEIVPAVTPELISTAHAIRHQVYCVEHDYEQQDADGGSGGEYDEYDTRAVQSLIRHRDTDCFAGVVRLVLPDSRLPASLFPMEGHCTGRIATACREMSAVSRSNIGEVSRFAVSKEFKRRIGEASCSGGISDQSRYEDSGSAAQHARRCLSFITLGLIAAVVKMSAQHGITHWCAVMEPSLLRLLARIGLHFNKVGPIVEYHGRRQPTVVALDDLLAGVFRERTDIWEILTGQGAVWPLKALAEQPPQMDKYVIGQHLLFGVNKVPVMVRRS